MKQPFLLVRERRASVLRRFVERGIVGVEILRVEMILRDAEGIAESLIVYYLALAEIFERFTDIGVVNKTKQIVVSYTRLLFC